NFMTGTLLRNDGECYFDEGRFKVKIVEHMHEALTAYQGKEVVFGIRAEDVYDKLFVSESSTDNTINATCEVVEPLGSEVYLYLNTGRHNFIARVGAHNRPEVNREMSLVFDMNKVHFFDPKPAHTII
ncbi:MAG: TOBE domain-containing protein, partial [Candidatus Omnitrophica bacterium]|nr:TOBE domain-containing protein [Candidatus Omnitrophota bacterium]